MGKFPSFKLLITALVVSCGGSFHFGYQLVITNPSQGAFIKFLNDSSIDHYGRSYDENSAKTVWSMIVAVLFLGAVFGSFCISTVSSRVGRKRGLYVSITFSIVSVLLAIISYHVHAYELYIVSRILTGFSISLSLGLAAMFLNESSPKQCRGFVSMMTGTMVQVGTFTGAIIAMQNVLGTTELWWYIYLIEIIILCVVLLLLPFFPESPSFLSQKGDNAAARNSIIFYYGCKIGAVDNVLSEIKEGIRQSSQRLSLIGAFRDHYARKGILVGIVIAFAMSWSGVAVVNAFAVEILRNAGLSPQDAAYGNIGLCSVSVVSSMIASIVVDRFGRRPLVLASLTVLLVLNCAVFVLMFCFNEFKKPWLGYFLVVIIALFLFFFAIGVGPLSFFVATEMVGQAARGVAQSCASFMQMISRTIILAIFLPLSTAIGQPISYLILFIAPVVASILFLYANMPETKNKDHKEVIEAMEKLPSITRCCRKKKPVRSFPDIPASLDGGDGDSCCTVKY